MDSSICVGIVTYNPDIERLKQNLDAIITQCKNIVLIDNASSNLEDIIFVKEKYKIDIISLDQNFGIAKALNVFMGYAQGNGYAWAMSLDQDSIVSPNIINEYKKNLSLPNVAALCPQIKKMNRQGQDKEKKMMSVKVEIVDRCPTTGFLCNVANFFITPGYDEWMFIDYVDYDICMKLRLAGYSIYKVNTVYVLQDLGKTNMDSWLSKIGKWIHSKKIYNMGITYNHSPLRNYFYVRNSLYYTRKYQNYINRKHEYSKISKWEIKKILLEKNRWETIKSIKSGWKDYKEKTDP